MFKHNFMNKKVAAMATIAVTLMGASGNLAALPTTVLASQTETAGTYTKDTLQNLITLAQSDTFKDKVASATTMQKKQFKQILANAVTAENSGNDTEYTTTGKALHRVMQAIDSYNKRDLASLVDQTSRKANLSDKDSTLTKAIVAAQNVLTNMNSSQGNIKDATLDLTNALKDNGMSVDDSGKDSQKPTQKQNDNGNDDAKQAAHDAAESDNSFAKDHDKDVDTNHGKVNDGQSENSNTDKTQINTDPDNDAAVKGDSSSKHNNTSGVVVIDDSKKDGDQIAEDIEKAAGQYMHLKTKLADSSAVEDLNDALTDAKAVKDSQNESVKERASKRLERAINEVDSTAKKQLRLNAAEMQGIMATSQFGKLSQRDQTTFQQALASLNTVIANPDASYADILSAQIASNMAMQNGLDYVDTTNLQAGVDEVNNLLNTNASKDFSKADKEQLEDNLSQAQRLIANKTASQTETDSMLTTLRSSELQALTDALLESKSEATMNGTKSTAKTVKNAAKSSGSSRSSKSSSKGSTGSRLVGAHYVKGDVDNGPVLSKNKKHDSKSAGSSDSDGSNGNNSSNDGKDNAYDSGKGSHKTVKEGLTDSSQSGDGPESSGDASHSTHGALPQTGHFIIQHAKAFMAGIGAACLALIGYLIYDKKHGTKKSN